MPKPTFTLKDWQATFRRNVAAQRTAEPPAKEPDEFDAQLAGIIADARQLGVREYQNTILTTLYQMDRANAAVQRELAKYHSPDDVYQTFTDTWDALKKLIREIENGTVQ